LCCPAPFTGRPSVPQPLYRSRPSSRSADWTSVSAPALPEFRQLALHPSQNRCVRQPDTSIRHHNHQASKTQFETRVPADTLDDDLSVAMSSLEQCFDRNERLHSAIIPDRGLFAPEPNPARSLRTKRLTELRAFPCERRCAPIPKVEPYRRPARRLSKCDCLRARHHSSACFSASTFAIPYRS
jgi:hypothetical protein